MTPAQAIASLDAQLMLHGEDVVLQRVTPAGVTDTATVRAFVRGYSPDELVGSIKQGASKVIMSPTDIDASGWPSAAVTAGDARLPRQGDRIVIGGLPRVVEMSTGIRIGAALVRIECRLKGSTT